jgi:hypothetical protein
MDRPPPSKRMHAGSNPAESPITTYGELAERQGIAVLTRRDLRVGQVRLLHSPPICGSGIDGCASVLQTDQARSLLAARSNSPLRPVSLPARISVLQTEETGSTPVRGSNSPGCGSGPTDPPLKRRSARERRARSNRAPGAIIPDQTAAARRRAAVAHNDRQPGSSPGAATTIQPSPLAAFPHTPLPAGAAGGAIAFARPVSLVICR